MYQTGIIEKHGGQLADQHDLLYDYCFGTGPTDLPRHEIRRDTDHGLLLSVSYISSTLALISTLQNANHIPAISLRLLRPQTILAYRT